MRLFLFCVKEADPGCHLGFLYRHTHLAEMFRLGSGMMTDHFIVEPIGDDERNHTKGFTKGCS